MLKNTPVNTSNIGFSSSFQNSTQFALNILFMAMVKSVFSGKKFSSHCIHLQVGQCEILLFWYRIYLPVHIDIGHQLIDLQISLTITIFRLHFQCEIETKI